MTDEDLQALYDKLRLKLSKCLERNNIAFIMGGSKDMFAQICQTYKEQVQKHKILIISTANKDQMPQKEAYKNLSGEEIFFKEPNNLEKFGETLM